MFKKKYLVVGVILVVVGLGAYIARWEFRAPTFEIYFFNLNKGRSIFIRTPHGKTLLIDGGQNSQVIRELTNVLPFYRRHIDTVVATRADPKNVGGLIDVLNRYDVDKIYEPSVEGTSTAFSAFEGIAQKKHIPREKLSKGDQFDYDGLHFEVLFPDPTFDWNKSNIPELAFKIVYKDKTMVLLGDLSPHIQKSLLPLLDHVFLVEFAHGATKSRVSADLLGKLSPDVTVSTKREGTLRYEIK
jgi:competence protein ComEC